MSTILPPRRQIPPPPPPRGVNSRAVDVQDTNTPPVFSLAARVASLQLNPVAQLPNRKAGKADTSYENSRTRSTSLEAPTKTFALVLAGLDPDYLSRLLARPPPPVPNKHYQEPEADHNSPPQLPPRRKIPPRPPLPSQADDDPAPSANVNTYHSYHTREDDLDEEGLYHNPEHGATAGTDHIPNVDGGETAADGLFAVGTCIKCRDFSAVDAHAAQFPRQHVGSLEELAYNLTEPFAYETEKARAIFTWMHHNVQYDAQSFFAGTVKPATPESTLSSGLAVCDGYAGLFVDLAQRAGLQAYKVSGHGKGFGYQDPAPGSPVPKMTTNHAWNCILLDGEWRLIDATWGAGALNGSTYEQRFDPSWFTSTPVEFARRHFPTDPTFQLIAEEYGGAINWEDYIMTPPGPVIFSDFYRLDFLVDLLQPASNVIENGQTVTFTLFKRCEHMTNHDTDNYVHVLLMPGAQPLPLEPNNEGGWGVTCRIENQTEISLMFIATVDGRDARGTGIRGFNNAVNRKPMTFGGLVKWTVV